MPTTVKPLLPEEATVGRMPWIPLRYLIRGPTTQPEALNSLLAEAPLLYDPWGSGLVYYPRETVHVEALGTDTWFGEAIYTSTPPTGGSIYQFDTTGNTEHISFSLETVKAYNADGEFTPDNQNAIGATAEGVAGCDIPTRRFEFSETHYLDPALVTEGYKAAVEAATGCTNSAVFRGREPGECLFYGAQGGQRGLGDWELTFHFGSRRNKTGLTVGNIEGIEKQGWEVLDVYSVPKEVGSAGDKRLIMVPQRVYVHRVFDPADFSLLGIGT